MHDGKHIMQWCCLLEGNTDQHQSCIRVSSRAQLLIRTEIATAMCTWASTATTVLCGRMYTHAAMTVCLSSKPLYIRHFRHQLTNNIRVYRDTQRYSSSDIVTSSNLSIILHFLVTFFRLATASFSERLLDLKVQET